MILCYLYSSYNKNLLSGKKVDQNVKGLPNNMQCVRQTWDLDQIYQQTKKLDHNFTSHVLGIIKHGAI